MPFYMAINRTPFTIQVQETNRPGDPWIVIEPEQCVPLWPKSDKKTLHVRAGDDGETVTRPFKLDEAQCTLLKMKNRVSFPSLLTLVITYCLVVLRANSLYYTHF